LGPEPKVVSNVRCGSGWLAEQERWVDETDVGNVVVVGVVVYRVVEFKRAAIGESDRVLSVEGEQYGAFVKFVLFGDE
jgi:hypothetical protein